MNIKIGVSARHMHICSSDLEYLFGPNYELIPEKYLTQEGEYASTDKVKIIGPKGELTVRILGPVREYTQVEVSKSDAYILGIKPPVRNSGNLNGSHPIVLSNGIKKIEKEEGCIIATRHIHIKTGDLEICGLEEGQLVKVKVNGEKGGIMDNVHVKSGLNFSFELHLDTDDANSHLINNGDIGEIIND